MRGDEGTAIVSGEIVRQGDTLRGYKVLRVHSGGIELQKGEEKEVIPYAK
jgi:hypothetical protein